MGKTVLVIGSGGREHALAWKLSQSPSVSKVYAAPGNGGTLKVAENVPLPVNDIPGLVAFAQDKKIDLTVVGPDDALAAGTVDAFQKKGLRIFGPRKAAAEIEASKAFAKQFMTRHGIPTAKFQTFTDFEAAREYLKGGEFPIVIKASGLALGKGVIIAADLDEAETAAHEILVEKIFGDAGAEIVIEEFLEGQEVSIHALSDGEDFVLFPPGQDHKAILDGDRGPNTGGMGTIAPVPWIRSELLKNISDGIVSPALRGMKEESRSFVGCLYPGLKITAAGPKVLEFNARFGDPETQSYMRLLKSDLYKLFEACLDRDLASFRTDWNPGFAATIVVASGGYPGTYIKGKPVTGIDEAEKIPGVKVFHAGTALGGEGLVTSGGRVLGVSAVGETLEAALKTAYEGVSKISFEGMQFRKDIGQKALRG